MNDRSNSTPPYGPDNPHPLSRMKTELVWEGKYDEYGNRRPVRLPASPLPLQRIETIDEPRDHAKALVQTGLFDDAAFAQKAHRDDFRNMLIWGDNKLALAALLEQFRGKVDLIYIDPPFDVGADFTMQVQIGDAGDAVEKEQSILEAVAYRDTWGKGTDSYLHMIYERLTLMRELLSENGSIYVHCDWHVGHFLKALALEVFGEESFINEITWHYYNKMAPISRCFPRASDRIISFSKAQGQHIFYQQYEKRDQPVKQLKRQFINGKAINVRDENGEVQYQLKEDRRLDDVWRISMLQPADKIQYLAYGTQKPEALLERIIKASSNEGDLVLDCFCVRSGTGVVCLSPTQRPSPTLPVRGEGAGDAGDAGDADNECTDHSAFSLPNLPPQAGGLEGGPLGEIIPIERIQAGDYVLAHDGRPRRVLRTFSRPYSGQMIGLRHPRSAATLWLTADHRVLAKPRPRNMGGDGGWSAVPPHHFERGRELRRNQTPAEQRLWARLRGEQIGYKFRRQHPIGPYIADFYSRDASLVVELDGETHATADAKAYDQQRNHYMRSLGLEVLRFNNINVFQNLDAVVDAICQQSDLQNISINEAEWVQANDLRPGDIVFFGVERVAVRLAAIEMKPVIDEQVFDLEVENAHSYITEICAIHNCGSGTTLAVAEKLGRRWIGVDLGRYAVHTTRKRLIGVQRELHKEGKPYRSFDVYNLGRYERQWWQFDRLKGFDVEHRNLVLRFYKAAPLESAPHPLLHGTRGGAFVHVDQIDGIFTFDNLRAAAEAARGAGARELHCLAWEFEMELALKKQAVEAETGLAVRLKYIPREIMESNRTEAQFFEAGYLEARAVTHAGKVDVELTRFVPSLAEAPEKEMAALRQRAITSPFDFIDFWAVDFTWREDKPFEHHWQDFRTRKDRSLRTRTDTGWKYAKPGRHQICVKVIDVFGVDTTTVIEVRV